MQMGGPSDLEGVENFLFNLFKDKYIIQLPWFMKPFQDLFAKLISRTRAPRIQEQYKEIGGASPIKFETESQAKALERFLNFKRAPGLGVKPSEQEQTKVYCAMRYSSPFLSETLKQIQADEIDELTVIPLYPQYSIATSGSSIIECKEVFAETGFDKKARIRYVESWHDNEYFIQLTYRRLVDKIVEFESEGVDAKHLHIMFSAHGLPVKYVEEGDPYQKQVLDSVRLVMSRLPGYKHSIAYQSRVGPVKWLEPSFEDELRRLAQEQNVKNLIVVPISFVGDHIETLFEIGIEYRQLAKDLGIRNFKITRLPKANKLLVQALASLVQASKSSSSCLSWDASFLFSSEIS